MVTKRNKIILVISLCVLIISVGVVVFSYLTDQEKSMSVANGEDEMMFSEVGEIELTEEQYQLLQDSLLHNSLEEMSSIERKNAWLILNVMDEIEFIENRYPGESGVDIAVWTLELLGVGEIREIDFVRIEEGAHDLAGTLILKIVNQESNVYYIWYNRTWGLGVVTTESEEGEMIYNSAIHTIRDGQICKREYPRGPIKSCRE